MDNATIDVNPTSHVRTPIHPHAHAPHAPHSRIGPRGSRLNFLYTSEFFGTEIDLAKITLCSMPIAVVCQRQRPRCVLRTLLVYLFYFAAPYPSLSLQQNTKPLSAIAAATFCMISEDSAGVLNAKLISNVCNMMPQPLQPVLNVNNSFFSCMDALPAPRNVQNPVDGCMILALQRTVAMILQDSTLSLTPTPTLAFESPTITPSALSLLVQLFSNWKTNLGYWRKYLLQTFVTPLDFNTIYYRCLDYGMRIVLRQSLVVNAILNLKQVQNICYHLRIRHICLQQRLQCPRKHLSSNQILMHSYGTHVSCILGTRRSAPV